MAKIVTTIDIHGKTYSVNIEELKWRPATYAIIIRDGKLLLTKQLGAYHLPGGGVYLGESLEEGLLREVKEETGITVTNPRLVECKSGYFTMTDGTHVQTILLYYLCDFASGELSLDGLMEDEKQHSEMPEWIPLDRLDAVKDGSTEGWRSAVKQVLKK